MVRKYAWKPSIGSMTSSCEEKKLISFDLVSFSNSGVDYIATFYSDFLNN